MNIHDIYSGTVMGSFPDDLRSGQEKRRERRKARQVEKDSTEIHVLSVSSDKCSPVKSRGWYERLFNQNVVVHAAFIGRSCSHIKLASKW